MIDTFKFKHWFPVLECEGYCDWKGQMEAIGVALPEKMVNPKKYCIPGKAARIRATIKAEKYSYLFVLGLR